MRKAEGTRPISLTLLCALRFVPCASPHDLSAIDEMPAREATALRGQLRYPPEGAAK